MKFVNNDPLKEEEGKKDIPISERYIPSDAFIENVIKSIGEILKRFRSESL